VSWRGCGFDCPTRVARALGCDVPERADAGEGISLTYQEFLDAVQGMREAGFEVHRDPVDAWPHFVGWRVNYERAAYAIAYEIDAPPAPWSGPRRLALPQYRPDRPPA
jgi:hypothetical protein